ncbi:protein angel homolog 1 [Pleuronectes platessa]|uniref:protein angel homolog 1 n=1 Tax=Pleuronectes platessa TaxID=8262 RepID=UPI00232A5279|nr:protein angel homolog 1 [Pleuronectes platessa]XP_053289788.1 protein angel homolog 1 [Pleuronectes platessa]
MIGSLLFYALYPLSRYLTARGRSEALKKVLPPAVVNGTAVWDGGSVTTGRFTQSQTTLLDQWLSPSSATKGETKERMKEQSSEKEDDAEIQPEKEQPVAVKREETEAVKTSESQQDKMKVPKPEENHEELFRKPNTDDATISPAEEISPVQGLGEKLKCLQTDDGTVESACLMQDQIQIHAIKESVIPSTHIMQETTCPAQSLPSMDESTANQMTECWDEYCIAPTAEEMRAGTCSSNLVFASPLFNSQTHLKFSERHNEPTGWHFPVGPGLAEVVECPLWQFPAGSYYPPIETTVPFEVMWRVWQEMDESEPAAEPTLIPFPCTKALVDFTVMSYNILAQDLLEAHEELYVHCPLEVLDWSYRCSLVLEEIMKWAPDILCLQEVQENHYHEQLHPSLCEMGYTCVYKRRTGTKTDGCAICYRSSCFSEVSVTSLEFYRPDTELLNRHNVGIVLLLRLLVTHGSETKAKGPLHCVANTHLLFNPKRGDLKLAQLAIVLAEIDRVVKSCKAKGEQCNVVLCGDFNSVPQMPLYQLITTGELYYQGLPAWMISGQEDLSYKTHCYRLFAPLWPSCLGITDNCQYTTVNDLFESGRPKSGKCRHDFMLQLRYCPAACVRPVDLALIPGVTDNTPDASRENQSYERSFRHTLRHRLDLESVYKHILPGSGASEVTSLHSEMGATVDYIFFSPRRISSDQRAGGDCVSSGLKLISSLSLLSEDVLWSMKGLPNHMFPSDHLCLLAKFQLELNAA